MKKYLITGANGLLGKEIIRQALESSPDIEFLAISNNCVKLVNQFGGESVTYEGVGGTKKWERLESYGPKFCENITQAIARDVLMYAMQTLRCCRIVAHVHDEVIIECRKDMSLDAVCEQMGRTPPWAEGLLLRADGYECQFYKKD